VVQPGAGLGEVAPTVRRLDDPSREADRRLRARGGEHDGVADGLDEPIIRAEGLPYAIDEHVDGRGGVAVAMDLRQGGETGEVDEHERERGISHLRIVPRHRPALIDRHSAAGRPELISRQFEVF
jgi:hypothetical protein